EVGQSLGIDHDRDSVAVEQVILGMNLVGVFDLVGETRASRSSHAQAQADTFPPPSEEVGDVLRRVLRQRNRHACITQSAASGALSAATALPSGALSPTCFFRSSATAALIPSQAR